MHAFLRCGLADVLDALHRVGGVRAAKDAGSKNYGQRISRHAVCFLLQGDPGSRKPTVRAGNPSSAGP